MISDFKPQLRALRFLLFKFFGAAHLKHSNPRAYWKTLYHISIYSASFLLIISIKKGFIPQSAVTHFEEYVKEKLEEGQEGLIDIWAKEIASLGRWYFETTEPLTLQQKVFIDSFIEIAENYARRDLSFQGFEDYNGVYLLNSFGDPLPEFTSPGEGVEIHGMVFQEGVSNISLDEPLFLAWADYIYFASVLSRIESVFHRTKGHFTPEDLQEYQEESLEACHAGNDVYLKLSGLIGDVVVEDPVGELSNNLQELNF